MQTEFIDMMLTGQLKCQTKKANPDITKLNLFGSQRLFFQRISACERRSREKLAKKSYPLIVNAVYAILNIQKTYQSKV